MKENETVRKYNVRFNNLAVNTNWDLTALKWAYQRGLATRIKDEMAQLPEPPTLSAYRQEVLRIDSRYWKREEEKKREAQRSVSASAPKGSTSKKGSDTGKNTPAQNSSSTPSTSSKPASSGSQNKKNSGNQNAGKNTGSSSAPAGNKPAFMNHLGPDGKLLASERERRKANNLCAFCGGKHKFEDCNKKKASNAKGRAVETTPVATDSAPPESEK
jgi:hypothetical protein